MPVPAPAIKTFVLGDYQTNCFVVRASASHGNAPGNAACWIMDCGYAPEAMLDWIAANRLRPVAMLLTHAHPDHIAGCDLARKRFGAMPTYIHAAEAGFCGDPMLNLSVGLGDLVVVGEPDHYLHGGETLELEGDPWRVVHAPGHSPGGVLYVHDASRQAIVGDTLFAGSVGRSDFPTSDVAVFRRTIREVLMGLPDDMTIHPGHGPPTTIGRERRTNPFVVHGF